MGLAPVRTKKEQILHLAATDPFMRVSEIAEKVDTTTRYVRTTLSDAGVSLSELRRNYARSMERRLGVESGKSHQSRENEIAIDSHELIGKPQISQVVDAEAAGALHVSSDRSLLCVSKIGRIGKQLYMLNRILTPIHVVVTEELLTADGPLGQLLGLEKPGATRIIERSMEVLSAEAFIAQSLNMAPGSLVLRCMHVIVTQGVRVGVEISYYDALGVRLLLAEDEHTLEVVVKKTAS